MLRELVLGLASFLTAAFELDCTNRSDGNYAIGCSSTFGRCIAGVGYEYSCPMALKFNPESDQCDYDFNVKICKNRIGNDGKVVKANSFSCEGRSDGVYGKEECSPFFYLCTHGSREQKLCRSGLYFNAAKKACDFVDNIDTCRTYKRYPIKLAIRTSTASQAINCAHNADGVYPAGPCSKMYYQCSNGILNRKECFGSLKFNRQKMQCDYETEIPECINRPAIPPRPAQAPQQPPVPEFSCRGKPEGKYAGGEGACMGYFWMCVGGTAHKYNCPVGLFYNELSGQCDFRSDIAACGGAAANTATSPAPGAAMFDCRGKKDGFYESAPCAERFYQCSGGFVTHQICPKGLVFNLANGVCDYREQCNSEAAQEQSPIIDCLVSEDGFYANGRCLSTYTICSNGLSYMQQCPSGLVYSADAGACDLPQRCLSRSTIGYRADDVESLLRTEGRHEPEKITNQRPSGYTITKAQADVIKARNKVVPTCVGMDDGAYPLGRCSQDYYICLGQQTLLASCPPNLVFNPYVSQCDFPRQVFDCIEGPGPVIIQSQMGPGPAVSSQGEYGPPQQGPGPVTGFDRTVTSTVLSTGVNAVRPIQRSAENDRFCASRPDGLYSAGCETYFYSCTKKKAYRLYCPVGLYFALHEKKCDVLENVRECQRQMNIDQLITPPPYQGFNCTGRQDGYYSTKCSRSYYACLAGKASKFECPRGLIYEQDSRRCNFPTPAQGCTTEQVAPSVALDTSEASATATTRRPSDQGFCSTRADGVYGNGCSRKYFICAARKTFEYRCPEGEAFNSNVAACDTPENVPQCRILEAQMKRPSN